MVLRINEKPNPAGRVENLQEFSHGRNEQCLPYALPLIFLGDSQPAKPDAGHITRQFPGFFRRKKLRFYPAKIEREKAQDRFWVGSAFLYQDECPGDPPRRVLTRGLLEKQIERFTPAVKSIPVVSLCQRFDFMHAPWL